MNGEVFKTNICGAASFLLTFICSKCSYRPKKLKKSLTSDLKPRYVLTAKEDIDTPTGYHENFHRENLKVMATIIIHMDITTTTVQ